MQKVGLVNQIRWLLIACRRKCLVRSPHTEQRVLLACVEGGTPGGSRCSCTFTSSEEEYPTSSSNVAIVQVYQRQRDVRISISATIVEIVQITVYGFVVDNKYSTDIVDMINNIRLFENSKYLWGLAAFDNLALVMNSKIMKNM